MARPKRLAGGDDRGRQVVRLFTLLRALESARRGLTVQQLHDVVERECSLRTIYRDLEHLKQAGFPIEEQDGVWKASSSVPVGLASEPLEATDAFAILVSQSLWEPLGAFGPGPWLAKLRQRLAAHLTVEGRAMIAELSKSVSATIRRPTLLHEHTEILETIQQATCVEQLLEIVYATPGKQERARVVEPHHVLLKPGRAYLVAYCRSSEQFRTFAVQRIRRAQMLDDVFTRRSEFDSHEYATRAFGVHQGPMHDVVVLFTPPVAHLAHETRWHESARLEEHSNGAVRLSFRAAGLPEIAAWVASFGGKLVPLEPTELVGRVRELHQSGLSSLDAPGQ